MPGLRGNLCWGNRGSFTIYGEYPLAGLDPTEVHVSPAPGTYVSTNAYYGHHRVPTEHPPNDPSEDMDVSEALPTVSGDLLASQPWTQNAVTRKRLHQDPVFHSFKRIRQDDRKIKEEEDLQFMEHYLKQTHGCEYYSFKYCS